MGLIRMHLPNAIHFITNRCEHEMFLLLPTETTKHLILFWLAKAKAKYGDGIELFGFIFLSNHFHLLLRDTKGQLAEFMGYFQANLAKSVNAELGRRGKFWAREYDDVIVDGEEEFWNRYAYVFCNPVKSGLVALPSQWRGVSSLEYAVENKSIEVTGINKSLYNDAKRFKKNVDPKEFEESYSFKLTHPDAWRYWNNNKRASTIKELLASACVEYRKNRLYKPALGMRKIMGQSPFDRPKDPAKSPRFKFFCMNRDRLKELNEAYRTFVDYYRRCLQALYSIIRSKHPRRAARIEWPPGSYPPTLHQPIG
jgi:hypothetical protein